MENGFKNSRLSIAVWLRSANIAPGYVAASAFAVQLQAPCITRAQTSPTKWLNSAPISFVLFGS